MLTFTSVFNLTNKKYDSSAAISFGKIRKIISDSYHFIFENLNENLALNIWNDEHKKTKYAYRSYKNKMFIFEAKIGQLKEVVQSFKLQ